MTEDAKRIIDDSIRAVLPDAAVYRALEGRRFDRPVTVIAIGKAAWRMANAAAKALGENLREGIVITKYGHSEGDIPRMTIYEAAHPIPDEAGVAATRAALALADRMTEQDEVIFLVSGGGSALFEQPLEGVTLDDCAEITQQLLACGADIVQINTIRKHLSAVKGGRFAQRCAPAHVLAIVLSDVLGDSLDSPPGRAIRIAPPAGTSSSSSSAIIWSSRRTSCPRCKRKRPSSSITWRRRSPATSAPSATRRRPRPRRWAIAR